MKTIKFKGLHKLMTCYDLNMNILVLMNVDNTNFNIQYDKI